MSSEERAAVKISSRVLTITFLQSCCVLALVLVGNTLLNVGLTHGNTIAAFRFSNKTNWRLDHENTCFDSRGALERDDCLIRAKPYQLWAKRTFIRGQLRQTGERHLSSASEEWLRRLCLPAIRAPLSTSPSPASSILVVSCHAKKKTTRELWRSLGAKYGFHFMLCMTHKTSRTLKMSDL